MADQKITADDPELDEDGKPIPLVENKENEEAESKESKEDEGENGTLPLKKEEEKSEEEIIPVRKSAGQHIIARQKRTIEKLRSKEEEEESLPSMEEDEDGLTPQAKGAVAREVQRHVEPLLKTIASKVDEDELSELFSREPNAKKYEKRIRVFMEHPNYRGVSPAFIYQGLAFKDAQSTGAKRKKVADTEADQMRGGGTSRRPTIKASNIPSAEEMDEMTDAEFEELQHKTQLGAFISKE